MNFWSGGHWCKKFGSDLIYGRSLKFTGLSNDRGDLAWTLELEVWCSMGDMTDVARGNEMAESSSWTIKECWWEGMARQGSTIESKVGGGSLEDNNLAGGNKPAKGSNWEECNNLKKCSRSKKCISSENKSLKEGRLEESNVGENNIGNSNKLEEGTSKENNDGEFEDIGEWRSKRE